MSTLLDTHVLLELQRPAPETAVLAWLASQPVESLWVSAVTEAEMRLGVRLLAPGQVAAEQPIQRHLKRRASAAGCEQTNAQPHLRFGDGADPQALDRLRRQPGEHGRLGCRTLKLRQHVGVKQGAHRRRAGALPAAGGAKSGGSRIGSRGSIAMGSPSKPAKRARMRLPRS
jgi:hypothetical protein